MISRLESASRDFGSPKGAVIEAVSADSPTEKAGGLRKGAERRLDVIVGTLDPKAA